MNVELKHKVETEESLYLQDYLKQYLLEYFITGSAAKKSIKKNLVLVNGNLGRSNTIIHYHDIIEILQDQSTPPKPFEIALDILFEDQHLAVINKPAGIPVNGNQFRTIQNAIIDKLFPSSESDALNWPKPVHRLDEPTSGILLIAKTKHAQLDLSRQFEEREIKKTYHAIGLGQSDQESIAITIQDKEALTKIVHRETYESQKYGPVTLFKLQPKTGRKHQIRIHLASIDCPIMGDREYGDYKTNYFQKGLFLCATGISFIHPFSKEMVSFELDLPRKFTKYLKLIAHTQ